MLNRVLLLIVIFLPLCSCKQVDSKNIETSKKIETSKPKEVVEVREEKKELTKPKPLRESYLVNDSLIIDWIIGLERIVKNSKLEMSKKTIQNRHVDNLMDTIITRTYGKTKLISYKTVSKEWVYKASIEDSEVGLNKIIRVGNDITAIEKHLKFGIHTNLLRIKNIEQTSEFILKFESRELKRIEFKGYVD